MLLGRAIEDIPCGADVQFDPQTGHVMRYLPNVDELEAPEIGDVVRFYSDAQEFRAAIITQTRNSGAGSVNHLQDVHTVDLAVFEPTTGKTYPMFAVKRGMGTGEWWGRE